MARNIFIAGASRGLGLEFAKQYAAAGENVTATIRDEAGKDGLASAGKKIRVLKLDISDQGSRNECLSQVREPIDILIVNAGVSGKRLPTRELDRDDYLSVIEVNALSPLLFLNSCLPHIRKGGKLVAITSKMGSIEDNTSGELLPYRASKAALNAGWKCASIDYADRGFSFLLLHPGWVRTDMGGQSAPLLPPESIAGMRQVIDSYSEPGEPAQFFDYSGAVLPW